MRKHVACAAALLILISGASRAETIQLDHETACDLLAAQTTRYKLFTVAMQASRLRAAGQETEASRAAGEDARRNIVDITREQCTQITGAFKVVERRKAPGGAYLLVQHDPSSRKLWVMQ